MENRDKIIALLRAFIAQRPGMDPRNYGDAASYRAESRSITQDRHDAEMLLRQVELMTSSIPEAKLREAFRAYSGRLTLTDTPKGLRLDYCTGQYFPTEYRRAVCAVLASALWEARRASMPTPTAWRVDAWHGQDRVAPYLHASREAAQQWLAANGGTTRGHVVDIVGNQTPGDWLRRTFRAQFGQRIARRYFN
jgi:hypothetical protein